MNWDNAAQAISRWFWRKREYVLEGGDSASAGRPAVLDSGGKWDASLIDDADIDHGSIGGLTDDDHTGYARLAGRSGGQTLIGGTGSGDDVELQSSSHATRGYVVLGDIVRTRSESLTISGGVITVSKSRVIVDTEGAAATDDLDTINGGEDGAILFIRISNSSRSVVLKHGTGNLNHARTGDSDVTLSNNDELRMYVYVSAVSAWVYIT